MDTLTAPVLQFGAGTPDRAVMVIDDLDERTAMYLAWEAVMQARQSVPRVTGRTALRLQPMWGDEYFGIWFPDNYVWFMERGTKAFTMRSIAEASFGRKIPKSRHDELRTGAPRSSSSAEPPESDNGRQFSRKTESPVNISPPACRLRIQAHPVVLLVGFLVNHSLRAEKSAVR
jgi:hypothetical protein